MVETVFQRLQTQPLPTDSSLPKAYLVGNTPPDCLGYACVTQGSYDAVIIGSLPPSQLLYFRNEAVLHALLTGMSVFLWEPGLGHHTYASNNNRLLRSRLLSAQRDLRQMGITFYGSKERQLLTADYAKQLRMQGAPLPTGMIITPLAKEVWEGRGQ